MQTRLADLTKLQKEAIEWKQKSKAAEEEVWTRAVLMYKTWAEICHLL